MPARIKHVTFKWGVKNKFFTTKKFLSPWNIYEKRKKEGV